MQSPIRSVERSSKREQRLQKYLKPGALARLRDARINAYHAGTSRRTNLLLLLPLPATTTQPTMADDAPCFKVRCFGPSFPQRKKLLASRAFFMPAIAQTAPSGPTAVATAAASGMLDTLDIFPPPVDILAVH